MLPAAPAPTPPAPPARARPRLPFTLYALAGILLLKAILLLTVVLLADVAEAGAATTSPAVVQLVESIRRTPGTDVVLVVIAIAIAVPVLLLLARRRIGWLLTMVVTGVLVASDIYAFALGSANHLWMALNLISVFYLNQRDVREAIGAATPLPADHTDGTEGTVVTA